MFAGFDSSCALCGGACYAQPCLYDAVTMQKPDLIETELPRTSDQASLRTCYSEKHCRAHVRMKKASASSTVSPSPPRFRGRSSHVGPTPVCGPRGDHRASKQNKTNEPANNAGRSQATHVNFPLRNQKQQPLTRIPRRTLFYLTHLHIITLQTTPPHRLPASVCPTPQRKLILASLHGPTLHFFFTSAGRHGARGPL